MNRWDDGGAFSLHGAAVDPNMTDDEWATVIGHASLCAPNRDELLEHY